MNTPAEDQKPLYKYSEFGLAVGVLVILFVLIIPLPTFLLDIFITINISLNIKPLKNCPGEGCAAAWDWCMVMVTAI